KNMLINYSWPGNVRELKNIAEQVSVLSQDKQVSATEFRKFLPEHSINRLPVLVAHNGSSHAEFSNERDLLYKLFFDMKKDVTELKKMFVDILKNPANIASATSYAQESLIHDYPVMNELQNSTASPAIMQ